MSSATVDVPPAVPKAGERVSTRDAIVQALTAAPGRQLRVRNLTPLVREITGRDMDDAVVGNAVRQMTKEGTVSREGRGVYVLRDPGDVPGPRTRKAITAMRRKPKRPPTTSAKKPWAAGTPGTLETLKAKHAAVVEKIEALVKVRDGYELVMRDLGGA